MKKEQNHSNKKNGQSLVEMAVVLVILLFLVGGIVDLGRAFSSTMILRDAVHEGALYGSTDPENTTAIKLHVLNSSAMVPDMISGNDIKVEVIGNPCTGNRIRITADYSDFPIIMPFIGAILGGQTFSLGATVTHTILRPEC